MQYHSTNCASILIETKLLQARFCKYKEHLQNSSKAIVTIEIYISIAHLRFSFLFFLYMFKDKRKEWMVIVVCENIKKLRNFNILMK